MMIAYRIKDWAATFERSDLKKTHGWKWVAVPNKHDGKGYRRLTMLPNSVNLFCAWNLIYQVASKMPDRGVLVDEDGPLSPDDLSAKTGFPAFIFSEAYRDLSDTALKIQWLEKFEVDSIRIPPEVSGDIPTTEQNRTEQNPSIPGGAPGERQRGSERGPIGADGPTEDDIYRAYPRHVEPQAAKKAIRNAISSIRARGTPHPTAWLLGRVQQYAEARRRLTQSDPASKQFTPYPQKWFNRARYDEDPAQWADSPNGHARPGMRVPANRLAQPREDN